MNAVKRAGRTHTQTQERNVPAAIPKHSHSPYDQTVQGARRHYEATLDPNKKTIHRSLNPPRTISSFKTVCIHDAVEHDAANPVFKFYGIGPCTIPTQSLIEKRPNLIRGHPETKRPRHDEDRELSRQYSTDSTDSTDGPVPVTGDTWT